MTLILLRTAISFRRFAGVSIAVCSPLFLSRRAHYDIVYEREQQFDRVQYFDGPSRRKEWGPALQTWNGERGACALHALPVRAVRVPTLFFPSFFSFLSFFPSFPASFPSFPFENGRHGVGVVRGNGQRGSPGGRSCCPYCPPLSAFLRSFLPSPC